MSGGGVPANSEATHIPDQFRNVFSGIGKLSEYQLSLHINQRTHLLRRNQGRFLSRCRLSNFLPLILEKVNGPTTRVSPAVFGQKRRRWWGSRRTPHRFSKVVWNLGFHQTEPHQRILGISLLLSLDTVSIKRLSLGVTSAPEEYRSNICQTVAIWHSWSNKHSQWYHCSWEGCQGAWWENRWVVSALRGEEHNTQEREMFVSMWIELSSLSCSLRGMVLGQPKRKLERCGTRKLNFDECFSSA